MNAQKIIDQLKNFSAGMSKADLDAAITPIQADLAAIKQTEVENAAKFVAIQAALDANAANDLDDESAIQAIADAVAPVQAAPSVPVSPPADAPPAENPPESPSDAPGPSDQAAS